MTFGKKMVETTQRRRCYQSSEKRHRCILRLTDLLDKVAPATPTPEEVRANRVVEALEQAGTTAARRLLTDLAGGVAEARLTREAKAAQQRLGPARIP